MRDELAAFWLLRHGQSLGNVANDAARAGQLERLDLAQRDMDVPLSDLGVEQATAGRVIAQLVKANMAPEKGTGWHRHEAEFHIVFMTKGWARFMYGDVETLVEAGDCVHQRPGIVHYLFDYSPDMEYLEVVGPADFKSIDAPAPCEVPAPGGW